MATYYLAPGGADSNPGTAAAPWFSLQKANSVARPGDEFVMLPGTFGGGLYDAQFNWTASGTLAAPIVVRAQNPLGALLSYGAALSDQSKVFIHASYVEFHDLDVTQATMGGATSNPTDNWLRPEGTSPTNMLAGIKVVGCRVRKHAIPIRPAYVGGLLVEGCDLTTSYCGVDCFGCYDGDIRRNTITVENRTGGASTVNGSAVYTKGGCRNMRISRNLVVVTQTSPAAFMGIMMGGNSGAVNVFSASGWEAYNCYAWANIVRVNGGTLNGSAISDSGGKDCGAFNNVLDGAQYAFGCDYGGGEGGGGAGWSSDGANGDPSARNPTFWNNICVNCANGYRSTGQSGTPAIDYNLFYNVPANVPSQAHPFTADPLFVSLVTPDYHLQAGSPARSVGLVIAPRPAVNASAVVSGTIAVDTDFDGATRGGVWDLGVYAQTAAPSASPVVPASPSPSPSPSPAALPPLVLPRNASDWERAVTDHIRAAEARLDRLEGR